MEQDDQTWSLTAVTEEKDLGVLMSSDLSVQAVCRGCQESFECSPLNREALLQAGQVNFFDSVQVLCTTSSRIQYSSMVTISAEGYRLYGTGPETSNQVGRGVYD